MVAPAMQAVPPNPRRYGAVNWLGLWTLSMREIRRFAKVHTQTIAAPVVTTLLGMAGIHDAYTCTTGHSRTMGNFIKAAFFALRKSYGYLTPDLWTPTVFMRSPYQDHSDFLANDKKALH